VGKESLMKYEDKLYVQMTLRQLEEVKDEVWRVAGTCAQETLIRAIAFQAWPPEGPRPSVDRGDLSSESWVVLQRIIQVLREAPKAPTLKRVEETGHEGPKG
jgi:hypothetical protein